MMVTWAVVIDSSFTWLSVGQPLYLQVVVQLTSDKNTTTEQHDYLAKEGDGSNVDVLWSENFHREKDVSIKM